MKELEEALYFKQRTYRCVVEGPSPGVLGIRGEV